VGIQKMLSVDLSKTSMVLKLLVFEKLEIIPNHIICWEKSFEFWSDVPFLS
jgi:hypothetical protein